LDLGSMRFLCWERWLPWEWPIQSKSIKKFCSYSWSEEYQN